MGLRQGANVSFLSGGDDEEGVSVSNQVGIGFRYYFLAGPYLQLGPQVNYLLSQSLKLKTTIGEASIEVPIYSEEFSVSNIDWGFFGGVDMLFHLAYL